ncbi:MAG: hypothetical protein QXE51_03300 [Nitrososphaeria archaeon]
MRFTRRSLAQATLTKGAETTVDIPRDYFIQRMLLKVDVTYNTGSSVSKTGTIWDLIKEVRVQREGQRSDIPFKMTGQQIRGLAKYDYMKEPSSTDFSTATGQSGLVATAYVPVDFRIDKWNDADISALLDAFNYSSLKLVLNMGTESDVGTGYTFSSITVIPTLVEVVPESLEKDFKPLNHTMSYASFGSLSANQPADLRTGLALRRLVLITSSDSAITSFRILSGSQNVIPETNFLANKQIDLIEYSPPSLETGWTIVDFSEINGLKGILNLYDAKQGDVKLYVTPSSGSASVTVIYDALEP